MSIPTDIFSGTNISDLFALVYYILIISHSDQLVSAYELESVSCDIVDLSYTNSCGADSNSASACSIEICGGLCGSNTMCSGSLSDNTTQNCACLPGFDLPFISATLCVPVPSTSTTIAIGAGVGGGLLLIIAIIVIVVVVRRRRRNQSGSGGKSAPQRENSVSA